MSLINKMNQYFKLARIHQWTKNLLIFAPSFFSGSFRLENFSPLLITFFSFSFAASSVYILNDFLDIEADKHHDKKKNRPLASGALSRGEGIVFFGFLIFMSFFLASCVSLKLVSLISFYLVLQLAYSIILKHVPVVETVIVSFSYFIRLLVGSTPIGIVLSPWIIVVTFTLALMLTFGKRYLEKVNSKGNSHSRKVLEHYSEEFLKLSFTSFGGASFVLYLLWCQEKAHESGERFLEVIGSALFLLIGVLSYQRKVLLNKFDEDPTQGLIRDKEICFSILGFVLYLSMILYVGEINVY